MKQIFLKQFLVSEQYDPAFPDRKLKAAFILQTCGAKAREEFETRFGVKAGNCFQTATSTLTKEDLQSHDFWKERQSWELDTPDHVQSEGQKRYFEMKEAAEKMTAAKKQAGISDWETATDEQMKTLNDLLKR